MSRSAPYMANARAMSYYKNPHLKQDPETKAKVSASNYYENLLLGVIDGFTSNFNEQCRSGLAETVRNGFSVVNNIEIYDPRKVAKFNIANVGLTEATNIVYAYCDVSHLITQFSGLANYEDYDQYIVLVSRVAGAFVNTVGELTECVNDGQRKGNGYDVGLCSSTLASVLLDTSL